MRSSRQNGIRWTDGDAAVPAALFAGMSGPGLLMLQFGAMTRVSRRGHRLPSRIAAALINDPQ